MMKRAVQATLICTIVLSIMSIAAAQQEPVPVVRMGDWIEIGDDVFMNFIAQTRIHYQWTHNYDFEDDIRDRVESRSNTSTVPMTATATSCFKSRVSVSICATRKICRCGSCLKIR